MARSHLSSCDWRFRWVAFPAHCQLRI